MGEQKAKTRVSLLIRILTVIALLLIIAAAVRYISLKLDLRLGAQLYHQGEYEQAVETLQPLRGQLLAGLGLRVQAERFIGLSKAEIACRQALEERTVAGYDKAIEALKEAQFLTRNAQGIQERIDEFTEYRDNMVANSRLTPSTEAPQPLPEEAGQNVQ